MRPALLAAAQQAAQGAQVWVSAEGVSASQQAMASRGHTGLVRRGVHTGMVQRGGRPGPEGQQAAGSHRSGPPRRASQPA